MLFSKKSCQNKRLADQKTQTETSNILCSTFPKTSPESREVHNILFYSSVLSNLLLCTVQNKIFPVAKKCKVEFYSFKKNFP